MKRISSLIVAVLAFSAISVMAQAPKVSHVWPDAGINEDTLTAHIYGGDFVVAPILSVKLMKTGYPDINGSSISVESGEYLTCSFDLTDDSTGLYDLVVANTFGEDTLPKCFTVYSASLSPSYAWEQTTLGAGGSSMYGVALGDGNGDGETEVYGACLDGSIYQFKWDGMTWDKTIVGAGAAGMRGVAVGDGNGDGEMEVYGAVVQPDNIYQFKWDGASWVKTALNFSNASRKALAVGDGNGDGEIEVYGSVHWGSVHQFKWDGAGWVRTTVWPPSMFETVEGVAVGDGNGDGEMEVYGACDDWHMYQFKWDGASWVTDTIGVGGSSMYGVAVGDGNDDGESEVYGAGVGGIYQFQWNGGSWARTTVGSGGAPMRKVAVGDGNGDGETEVYGACLDGSIYQFKWDGMTWDKTIVGAGAAQMWGVAVGDGNGDGKMEMYGANGDFIIYQFKPAFIPDIELSNDSRDFGAVLLGDSLDWEYLVISNAGVDTLFVDSLVSDTADYVIVSPSFPDTILASGSTNVTVRFKPLSEGLIPGTLWVYSNDPDESILYVTLTGEAYTEPDIELPDTTHDFGLVLLGDSVDWEYLVIRNVGNADLLVGGITSDTTAYIVVSPSFPDTILPDDSTLVTVRFKPLDEGVVAGTLTIVSTDPDESPAFVTLTGRGYLEEPEIALSDTVYDFGGVDVGDSLDWQWLIIRNVGFDTLFVDSLISDTADYLVADPILPDTILPDDSTLVTVRFRPSNVGAVTGTLTIYSNDPDGSPAYVTLMGEGLTGIEEVTARLRVPTAFTLYQCIPNPFCVSASIGYGLPQDADVVLEIYDIAGRLIEALVREHQIAGYHSAFWNGTDRSGKEVRAGVYFYRLTAAQFTATRKVVVVK